MKLPAILVAAGIVAGSLGATAAQADRYDRGPRHGWHGDHRGYRDHGFRHRHCRTFFHHGHRVTRCD